MTSTQKTGTPPRWYRPTAIARSLALRPRVYLAMGAGLLTAVLLPKGLSRNLGGLVVADIAFLTYLALSFRVMATFSHDAVRKRAARQDHGRIVILAIVLLAIVASFVAIAGVLRDARAASGEAKLMLIALSASTVFLSWLVTQVVFMFHYAHEYYYPEEGGMHRGGLMFPGDDGPDYWDFFYFATSIGAASQTSDVSIRTKALRRLTTLHAIVSFFFNTAVLALAINIGSSLI